MVLITSLGDWILTGGKLIRCTVDRNITCLQEEEIRYGWVRGGGVEKKEKRRTVKGKVREEKNKTETEKMREQLSDCSSIFVL